MSLGPSYMLKEHKTKEGTKEGRKEGYFKIGEN